MKKKLTVLLMICCLLMAPATAWADSSSTVQPRYTYVDVVHTIFGVTDSGVACCYVSLNEDAVKTFTYSKLTVYIKKSSNDATVKTFTVTKYPDASGFFDWYGEYQLTARGTYYIKATNKLYKNGNLVETIHTRSQNDTY
ncbi:MAG: hypothetical protein IKJ77_09755 [Firmicutes bacterium]|nr:hypothetical protein [Bacillota bacterium]